MDYIETGIAKNLISLNPERTRIKYVRQNKSYNFNDPEERVRAEAYVQLVEDYGYPVGRISLEMEVRMGVSKKSADIIIYEDDAKSAPYIVVECKKAEATDAEYKLGIDEGFSYANALKASYLWVTSRTLDSYFDTINFGGQEREKNRLADIPRFGKRTLNKAKYYRGGVDEAGEKAFDIKTISQSEMTRKFKQAHDALWAGGKRNPSEAFDELDKLIFCKIWDEKRDRKRGTPYDFQVFTNEEAEDLWQRVQNIYEGGRQEDPEVFKDDIRLSPQELETVVGYLAPLNLNETDLDSKGRAFESFMGSFFRGEFGQYFTPRPVVDFIVDVLPIRNKDLVLDPACGSSGFLLHTLNKIRRLADEYYDATREQAKHYGFWHDFARDKLYGIEINEQIARTAKMNMIIHDDGHTNVLALDGLKPTGKIQEYAQRNKSRGYLNFRPARFDYILTNPPFGSTIKAREHSYIGDYDLGKKNFDWIQARLENVALDDERDSQKSEILFIEQCHKFLKPGGFLAVVLPDGVLTNSSLQYVRDWIEEHFRLVGVVSLPQTAFTHTGAGVKSSVLFARKYDERTTESIRALKQGVRDELFAEERFGGVLHRLLQEKAFKLKRGDAFVQEVNETLANHVKALRDQGTLERSEQRELERRARERIKEHQLTDEYKAWKQALTDEYNEKIETVREALQEEVLAEVKRKVTNYPIFMAIAEEIGYDATGRETRRNDLHDIGAELKRFIEAVSEGKDDFFVSAPV